MMETETIRVGENGLPMVVLRTPSGMFSADVYLHGAHCTAWNMKKRSLVRENEGNLFGTDDESTEEENLLYLSEKAVFQPPKAIRGGIPICWPQFSDLGSLEQQHGFARNTQFSLVEYRGNFARLRLSQDVSNDGNIFNKEFPHSFDLDMDIFLEDYTLKQTLRVKNTSSDSNESGNTMAFTSALHTYFSLKEGIEAASIEGLEGTKYLDSLQGRREIIEENKVICFQGEVDRIYCNTPNTITLKDGKERSFVIQKTNFSDAVIWNPAIEKSAKMNDFGDDDWKRMVCIEVAQAGSGRVELLPGQTWEASQSITLKTKDRN